MTQETRVAIVTGGTRGIGRAAALRLARAGRDVVIADVSDGGDVIAKIQGLGRRSFYAPTDVTRTEAVGAMVERTLATFGRVDILVNCAGILGREGPFLGVPDEEWFRVLDVNLHGVYFCCRAVLPVMLQQRWGRIVTITSGARRGAALFAPYATSKGAVTSLMNSLANAYAHEGVLINCLQPGRALTDMVVSRFSAEELANPDVPIGRYSSADEVATVVNYLCDDENTYTTGAVWNVAGGSE